MEPDETESKPLLSSKEFAKIEDAFAPHALTEHQVALCAEIRLQAESLATVILCNCPASADRSAALRKLREAIMTANASIAHEGMAVFW